MSKTIKQKIISIAGICLSAVMLFTGVGFAAVGGLVLKKEKGRDLGKGRISIDTESHIATLEGNNYRTSVNFDNCFRVDSIYLTETDYEVTDSYAGIYTAVNTSEGSYSSIFLDEAPSATKAGDNGVTFAYTDGLVNYTVKMTAYSECFKMNISRSFVKDCTVNSQSFPGFTFDRRSFESIRWNDSGSNFWIAGGGSKMTQWVSEGVGYDENRNTRRAMQETDLTLLSDYATKAAINISTRGSNRNAKGNSVETDRSQKDGYRNLLLDFESAPGNEELKFRTGDERYGYPTPGGSNQGMIGLSGSDMYKSFDVGAGYTDYIEVTVAADDYDSYYDLGVMNGLNESLISSMLNNFSRMSILGKDSGLTNMDINYFVQLPALEYHWLTNLVSVMNDDNAIESLKNGIRRIRDTIIDDNGHVLSPYPNLGQASWGAQYSDMQSAYLLAVADVWAITGDRAFMDEMRPTVEAVIEYLLYNYYDENRHLIMNAFSLNDVEPSPDKPFSEECPDYEAAINDYWERSNGVYNGYLTAIAYDAIKHTAEIEELVFGNKELSEKYYQIAADIKEAFNKDVADGGMWSPESKSFMYGSENLDIQHLPTQSAALKSDIVSVERKGELVASLEAAQANLNTKSHVFNVRDLRNTDNTASQESNVWYTFLGMNGGWYGSADGDYYAGLPYSGNRNYFTYYMNELCECFNDTSFVGMTAFMRDMKTPADYGWYTLMCLSAYPVYGLYSYCYGFQPQADRLNIAPYIDYGMEGSEIYYRFRGADYKVVYEDLFRFTVTAENLPADTYVRFINQTADKEYTVLVDGKAKTVKADADGVAEIRASKGTHTYELSNPDDENAARPNENLIETIRPSSTYNGQNVTEYWAENMMDGKRDGGYWQPDFMDDEPYLILTVGTKTLAKELKIFFEEAGRYAFNVYGADTLYNPEWTLIDNQSIAPPATDGDRSIGVTLNERYRYYKIVFTDASGLKINEMQLLG